MIQKIRRFNPAVDRRLLLALSGATWIIVGVILCNLAIGWLLSADPERTALLGLSGIFFSLLIHHFLFLRIVDRNIDRILPMKNKVCLFAFQPWKSYLIIAIMVGIGIILRHSPLPRPYLSVIYIGFGGAMLLSSIRYIRIFIKLILKS